MLQRGKTVNFDCRESAVEKFDAVKFDFSANARAARAEADAHFGRFAKGYFLGSIWTFPTGEIDQTGRKSDVR